MRLEVVFPNLGIEISELSRVAFSVFGIDVYFYGIFITLGVLCGIFYMTHEAKRTGQNLDNYTDFLLYAFIVGIICTRLYYVIFSWDSYKDNLLSIFLIRNGGLAIYGGAIGGVITAIVYTKVKKLNILLFLDTLAPAFLLGQAIGRWGNLFNREAFGGYTESIFAMQYLKEQVRDAPASVLENVVNVNGVQYIQVHPTFLYESLGCFALFAFINLYKKHKKFDGEIAAIYFGGYGFGRFFIEGIRTDQLVFGGFAVSQVLSFVLFVGSVAFMIYKRTREKHANI